MPNTGTGTEKSRADLESSFADNSYPNSSDFADVFASMYAKEDTIPTAALAYDAEQGDVDAKAYTDQKVSEVIPNKGLATTTTNPGTPTSYSIYDVYDAGTYTNFLDDTSTAIVVTTGDTAQGQVQLIFDPAAGYWQKKIVGIDLSGYVQKTALDTLIGTADDVADVYITSEASTTGIHNYSNFSGWGTPLGIQAAFNRITIKFTTRTTPPTRVDICLRQTNKTGTILVQLSQTGLSLAANTLVSVTFDLGTIINEPGQLYLQYATDQTITDYAIATSGAPFPYPTYPADSYTTNGNLNFSASWGDDSSHCNHYFALYNVTTVTAPDTDFANKIIAVSTDLQDAIAVKDGYDAAFENGYYESDDVAAFDKGIAVFQDTTSTFAGWFSPMGTPQNFNAVKLTIRGKSTNTGNITKVKVWIIQGGKAGTILATGEVTGLAIAALQSQELLIPLSATVANASAAQLSFAFDCDNHVDNFGFSGGTSCPFPSGGVYATAAYTTSVSPDSVSPSSFTDVSNPTVSQRNVYIETLTISIGSIPTDGLMGVLAEKLKDYDLVNLQDLITVDIFLPSTLYALEGYELNVWWDNIIFSNIDNSNLTIDVTCLKGAQLERGWRYTPVASDAGSTALTISVSVNGVIVATKTATVITNALSAATGKSAKVLCIGDSTTAGGQYINTILTEHSSDPTLTFIGTQGTAPANHEGRGGWKFSDYATVGRTFYVFNLTGVTTAPGIGATYTHNSSTYTVDEVNITGGAGYISCERTTGTNNPLSTGTLTKATGTGDATLTFGSTSTVSGNPFWNGTTSQLDFANYLSTNGFSMAATDFITIHLGINDVFNGVNQALLDSIKTNCDALIAAFRAAVAGIQIGLCVTIPPSISQDAFGADYTTGQTLKGYLENYKQLVAFLLSTYDTADNIINGIYCIPFNVNLDRTYNMQVANVVANARIATTVTTYTNGVHPDTPGYDQMSDVLFPFVVDKL